MACDETIDPARKALARQAGLCSACRHAHAIENSRGSVFLRCMRADEDPHFVRYPRLPVTACAGYEPGVEPALS